MSIPLFLVTGFFGSGKTSFLKCFLEQYGKHKKVAIIQNEFSSTNIDGKEINSTNAYRLLEVNNGSAFCVCLLGSFIKSLAEFVDKEQPDLLIMEASGMSDPIGVGQVFQAEQLKGKVFLDHVWCVVDACNYYKMNALRLRMEHQLQVADTIIINKTDIAGEQVKTVRDDIKHINPFARVERSTFACVDFTNMEKVKSFFPMENKKPGKRPDIESIVIKSNRVINSVKLNEFIEKIKGKSIRSKGYVNVENGKTIFVQGVFDDFEITNVSDYMGISELLLIGNFDASINYQSVFDDHCIISTVR